MVMSWQARSIERLRNTQQSCGGWAYGRSLEPAAEPTALACLALVASDRERERIERGLDFLLARQQKDGSVGVSQSRPTPGWATASAMLAWIAAGQTNRTKIQSAQSAALAWLLRAEGRPFKSNPAIYGHNTRLRGWAWIDGTHSWLEPTAWAVLALRAAEQPNHPRVREAVTLMLDRTLPSGGWNYGNSVMFGNELRPFPAQTGMVLAALAGEPLERCVEKALSYLEVELPRVRTPISLAWGIIGARAWQAEWPSSDAWLTECAHRLESVPANPMFDALLLLADSQPCPLIHTGGGVVHGV